MRKIACAIGIAVMGCGCVWTRETSEVVVHKSPEGRVIGVDYTERREQQDLKPWGRFGGYLEEYGSIKSK